MQNNPQNKTPRPDVKEPSVKPTAAEKPFIGVVTDCLRLNVRKEPDADAPVVAIVDALTQVTVDVEASTELFCKVHTLDGIEGFCMKQYIQLRR